MMSNSSNGIANNKQRIKIVGIGGAGGKFVNMMISKGVADVEFIAINTDKPALNISNANIKIQIGKRMYVGHVSAKQELARRAAEEDYESIQNALTGSDVVFLLAGLGGNTGSGVTPVVAEIIKKSAT